MAPVLDISVDDCNMQFTESQIQMDVRCQEVLEAVKNGLGYLFPEANGGSGDVIYVVVVVGGVIVGLLVIGRK